ncbi:hypothetical protein BN1221_01591 [Brenneria goodwinii]|uniref:Uncharacterized protein n=1 Tax=Brenneria goodwinii TaxID=1109412 RepID=A0A0G4JTE5_9GAMM|nr:hypothetical protein BN1221_01591 [Brenneria goodwinii]
MPLLSGISKKYYCGILFGTAFASPAQWRLATCYQNIINIHG